MTFSDRVRKLRAELAANPPKYKKIKRRRAPRIQLKPSEVRRLYHSKQLPLRTVAEILGCSKSWLYKYMKREKIEIRSRSVARQVAIRTGRVLTRNREEEPKWLS